MKLRIAGAVVCILQTLSLWSQNISETFPDYDYLLSQIELHESTPKVWPYLRQYLARAKQEKNWPEAVFAYKEMLHESEGSIRFIYADSMVAAARRSNDQDLLGSAYLTKGVAHYQNKEHQLALDNYLMANKYLVASEDGYLRHKVKYSIAQLKFYLGYYHEAISLFRECIEFFKAREPVPYLKSMHSLSLCYAYTDKHTQAEATIHLALQESARLKIKSLLPYLDMATGINLYKQKQYAKSIKYLADALPLISEEEDFASKATANFYLGKAYWDLAERERAIRYFMEVERLIKVKKFIRPELRRAYEYLIKYHHEQDQKDVELHYIEKLLEADTTLGREFRYLSNRIYKEYDTAELLAEKEAIQYELKRSRWSGWLVTGLAAILAIIIVWLVRRHKRLQKIYRQRFDDLVDPAKKVQQAIPEDTAKTLTINPSIVESILSKLEDLERKKGFLKKNIKTEKLAEDFGTNAKYLSKVVRYHKQKSFINYINDLRIDYLVERLKDEPLLRRYTHGALAEEAGFKTAQHFVVAFKKTTGMPPGFFVEELDKLDATGL